MSKSVSDYLRHIVRELEYLAGVASDLSEESFLSDDTLQRAFARSLEVIGEATKNLPAEWRAAHPAIDWPAMAGMRDRLIHGYFGVDYEIVWDVVSVRVPALREEIARLLEAEEAQPGGS